MEYHHVETEENSCVNTPNENDNERYGGKRKIICYDEEMHLIPQPIAVFKQRWFMLFIFSLNTAVSGILVMSLTPVNSIVSEYYNTSSVQIEWLTNIFILFYIFLGIPTSYCISNWGIRPVITVASCLNFISTIVHYPGYESHRFWLVLFGQVFSAISGVAILQIPGKLSFVWFADEQRATATSIGVLMNIFGIAIGFLQATLMIKRGDVSGVEKNLKMFYLSQIVLSALTFLLTFGYKEKPPLPPSAAIRQEHMPLRESARLLFYNKYFMFLSHAYGIYFGLYIAISALINPIVTSKFTGHEQDIGWMAFGNNALATLSIIVIGILLDRYRKFQLTAILLNLSSLICWLTFVILLTTVKECNAVFAAFVLLGLFFTPYNACGIEQAAEMTYPVPEETSSNMIILIGNIYSFLFIYLFGYALQKGYTVTVGYMIAVMYAISTLLATFSKTGTKRLNSTVATS